MAFTARTETYARGSSLSTPFNFTINKATGVVDGDIMFMFLMVYVSSPPTIDSIPEGWELVATNAAGNSRWYLYWKKASGEGVSYTWSLTKSTRYYALNIAYSSGDFDVTSISDITAISNTLYGTAGTTVRAASMDVPAANSPLVYFAAIYNTTVRTFTPPTAPVDSWSEDAQQGHTTPDISTTNGSMIWTGSGATGDMDIICSYSITTQKHAFAIALKPASAPITLIVQESLHTHVVENIVLAQIHNLIPIDIGHGQTVDAVVLTQVHNVSPQEIAHSHTADNTVLEVQSSIQLVVQDIGHTHTADNIGITEHKTLACSDSTHSQVSDIPALIQHYTLSCNNSTHSHSIENISITESKLIALAGITHEHLADAVELSQVHFLTAQEILHNHSCETPDLTEYQTLVAQNSIHEQNSDNISLVQSSLLNVQDILHGGTGESKFKRWTGSEWKSIGTIVVYQ